MYFSQLQFSFMALASIATAVALPEANVEKLDLEDHAVHLEARSNHEAHFYGGFGCSDPVDKFVFDFSCGGTCYTPEHSDGWESVYLQYSGSGDKPTANCYASNDCSGTAFKSGIAKGNTGCTVQQQKVHSCYVYYGC
jgi:hypothetical protein